MRSLLSITVPFLLLPVLPVAGLADSVELNGITSLFGDNMAFLVLHLDALPKPINFVLSEGQSQHGVKLLAIDVANRQVEIEEAGVTQRIRICSTPDINLPDLTASGVGRVLGPGEQAEINQFLASDAQVQKIKAGDPAADPTYIGAPSPAPTKANDATASSTGDASSAGNSAASSGSSGVAATGSSDAQATGATDYTQQYWYKTSLAIEQTRLATAQDVMNGTSDPLPRTPLTPASTPGALVGKDVYFANRIPGFVPADSVND